MAGHMRITVRLPDALLEQAQREARRRGETLRRELAHPPGRPNRKTRIPIFRGGTEVAPGVDLTNSAAL